MAELLTELPSDVDVEGMMTRTLLPQRPDGPPPAKKDGKEGSNKE